MKKLAVLLFIALPAFGDSSSLNLNLPTSPGSYKSDRFRADNLDCSMAIGSATNVEFGVVGILEAGDQNNPIGIYDDNMGSSRDVGVYARITIPIGAPKERLNCNILYKLELEKKRLEVLKLQQELNQLKALQFENK